METPSDAVRADFRASQRTIYLLKRVELYVTRELEKRLRPVDLSVTQFTAMEALKYRGGLSSAQLARRSLVTSQSMHEVVVSLERRGLIRRIPKPENQRILVAGLTEEGLTLLRECGGIVDSMEEQLLDGLSTDERRSFNGSLLRILAGLDRERTEVEDGPRR